MVKNDEVYLLKLNYMAPLFYPDCSLGSIAYIKRIRANLFYDISLTNCSVIQRKTDKEMFFNYNQSSCGIELYADVHFLRFIMPFIPFQTNCGVVRCL